MAQDVSLFSGEHEGISCETFIRLVRTHAFYAGKAWDYDWIAGYASTRFDGPARRWYESLDQSVQRDWNALKNALLEEYPSRENDSISTASSGSVTVTTSPSIAPSILSPGSPPKQPYIIDGVIRASYISQSVPEFVSCVNGVYVLSSDDKAALRVRAVYSDIRQSVATLNSKLQSIGLMFGRGVAWPASTGGTGPSTPPLGDVEGLDPTPWIIQRDGTIQATWMDESGVTRIFEAWILSHIDVKALLFLKDPDSSLQTGHLAKLRLFLEPVHFHSN